MHAGRSVLCGLVLLCASCGLLAPAPLGRVETESPAPSPGLRNLRNRLNIRYYLNQPAAVTSRIVSSSGSEWVMHARAPRPTRGDYVLHFDGTVSGPGPNERRVLADGDYRVLLEVESGGQRQEALIPIAVREADSQVPEITELTLLPDRISPNFDARDDVTRISYRLAKAARVSAFLDARTPSGAVRRLWMNDETRVPAGDQTMIYAGVINGQPVPSGEYIFGVRARDEAGNIVEQGTPLIVEESGTPEASLVQARIGPLQIIRGAHVCLDAIVRNAGQTVLRTQGPDPGYVYNSLDTYSSIEEHRYTEHAGYWRVGLNWSGGLDTNGATYPYRWGFGHDLSPGEEVTVHGCVKVLNEQDKVVFFAGLIQENVAIHNPGIGLVRVQVSS